MDRILFIVNGLGLGNSTRCHAVIDRLLARGVGVDVLTSGNGLDYFSRVEGIGALHAVAPLEYGSQDDKLSARATLWALPRQVRRALGNARAFRRLPRAGAYRGVVIDSDYSVAGFKHTLQVPVIGLNNADVVVHECRRRRPIPASVRGQYLIERGDRLFHRVFADHVLSPCLARAYPETATLEHIPPPIRGGLRVRGASSEVRRILVMLSGSRFASQATFLSGLQLPAGVAVDVVGRRGKSHGRITYHGKVFGNEALVNAADLMVVNGGHSAVSEAVLTRRPVVVIPVENHAEQYVNAGLVEELGLGLQASAAQAGRAIAAVLARFAELVENHRRFAFPLDGGEVAARRILELTGAPGAGGRPPRRAATPPPLAPHGAGRPP